MQQQLFDSDIAENLVGEGFWEYLLVVNPADDVAEKVWAEKDTFHKNYGHKMVVKTKPHITLANFLAKEDMEETLIRWLYRICSQEKGFHVTLNNFSSFPHGTIYVRVQDHEPFQQLVKKLRTIEPLIKSNHCPKVKFITNPHLTVARRIPPEIFLTASLDYAKRDFYAQFMAGQLTLLRRRHQFDTCTRISIFPLQPPQGFEKAA